MLRQLAHPKQFFNHNIIRKNIIIKNNKIACAIFSRTTTSTTSTKQPAAGENFVESIGWHPKQLVVPSEKTNRFKVVPAALANHVVDTFSLTSCQNDNGAAILAAMTTGTLMLMYISQENKQHTCESEKRTRSKDIDKPINNIVILMAMKQEAAPFIKQHNLKLIKHPPWNSNLPFVAYEGVVGGMNVKLVWAGHDKRYKVNNVATTASTLSCYIAFEAFKPDLIISAGTAGGFKSAGGEIADVYLSSKCVFHSRRIPDSDTGYSEYGFGHYRSPPLELLANEAQCKIGVISTSDSLDYTSKDLQIMRGEGACIKEMEAAAIAWVCQQCSVPFVGIKAITDIVDNDNDLESVDEFEQNLAKASNKLQEKLSILLKLMAGEKLSKWSL